MLMWQKSLDVCLQKSVLVEILIDVLETAFVHALYNISNWNPNMSDLNKTRQDLNQTKLH